MLSEEHLQQCFVLLAADDPDVQNGGYADVLQGTIWERKVILGLRGADVQARFAEDIAPSGCHVVIIDDNVTELFETHVQDEGRIQHRPVPDGGLSKLIGRAGDAMVSTKLNVPHPVATRTQTVINTQEWCLIMFDLVCNCGPVAVGFIIDSV